MRVPIRLICNDEDCSAEITQEKLCSRYHFRRGVPVLLRISPFRRSVESSRRFQTRFNETVAIAVGRMKWRR